MKATSYDIVIIGGGMVGATLACALGNSGLNIAVIETHAPAPVRPEEEIELRVSAISIASQRIFAALEAWPLITAQRVSPFRNMEVWDAAGAGLIHFDSADIGQPLLGYIIENRVIQSALWQRLAAYENIDRLCPARLLDFERRDDAIHIRLDGHRELETRLLVGADGARSKVRQDAGITTHGWDYEQHAVVATVHTEHPHLETAWQRFLSTGPLAFLPLRDGRCSIVWSTTPEQARKLLAMSADDFKTELKHAFGGRLGRILGTGERAALPLRLQHADAYVQPRLALIGDAAHTIHPLAGQGVNIGLLDAATLAEVILEAIAQGKDIGDYSVLRRYERGRKGSNLLMMGAMDAFKRGFGSSLAPVRWARNAGLNAVNAAVPMKNVIIEHAMGLKGELPALARAPL